MNQGKKETIMKKLIVQLFTVSAVALATIAVLSLSGCATWSTSSVSPIEGQPTVTTVASEQEEKKDPARIELITNQEIIDKNINH
jgi:outer membrane receptor for ferrienterochelin and colicin